MKASILREFLSGLYLKKRFFYASAFLVVTFSLSFKWQWLFMPALMSFIAVLLVLAVDVALLYSKTHPLEVSRKLSNLLSLGDTNTIVLTITNLTGLKYQAEILEDLPAELQVRDFSLKTTLPGFETVQLSYDIRPTDRAELEFGGTNVIISSPLQMVERKVHLSTSGNISVYPSIIQMKKFELRNMNKVARYNGVKKIRRIGQSYEFEKINNYVPGDDFRHINWKATGKYNSLMTNMYVEEKSQQVYCVIDKSRNMMLPFNGLNLLDYAINTSLVLSKVSLYKEDKAGLITFSNKVETFLKANNRQGQLKKIMESLYNEENTFTESNYEVFYNKLRHSISARSLIFLFTNFESHYNLERNLAVLRKNCSVPFIGCCNF
jgi:uncharacterized protein (DUF58 family)